MSNVESPSHYVQGYMEVIYEIRDILGAEGFKAFCMGNWIKYNARATHKNGAEDIAKAQQYLEWATNGLPKPVNNRVPRAESDVYSKVAREIYRGSADAFGYMTSKQDRVTVKLSSLGWSYGNPTKYKVGDVLRFKNIVGYVDNTCSLTIKSVSVDEKTKYYVINTAGGSYWLDESWLNDNTVKINA